MAIKSLRKRLTLLVLLPAGLLLLFIGVFGFIHLRGMLLADWQDASILKLQRAAQEIDTRMDRVINWIQMFNRTSDNGGGPLIQKWILDQLRSLKGVSRVEVKWKEDLGEQSVQGGAGPIVRTSMMRFSQVRIAEVTPPRYSAQEEEETVILISQFKDESNTVVGTLEVSVRFEYLLEGIKKLGWWQTEQACLIDKTGKYLCHTKAIMKGGIPFGGTGDAFETALLSDIKKKPFGTVLGPGQPPDQVGGFYRLRYAPWTIVLLASGEKVLMPIVQFRIYYFLAVAILILIILLLIRTVVGKMVRSFTEISKAAETVARGDYGQPIAVRGSDEIAQLTRSFNTMVEGLKEKDFVTNTFGRYVDHEIAKKLMELPEAARLGGEKREVAVLMSDIRGFTPLSESLDPDVIISLLNRYFSRLIEVIQRHQGIIVDFFGDSILVFFDPLKGPVGPVIRSSVQCALDMVRVLEIFNREMRMDGFPALQTGVGVNYGEVIVGNIGSETRSKYGIVGAPVNITHRIQAMAKGGEVVISQSVYRHISDAVLVGRSFSMALKGVREKMNLYEVKELHEFP